MRVPRIRLSKSAGKTKAWHYSFITIHFCYAFLEFTHGGLVAIAASCAAIAVALDAYFNSMGE